MNTTLSPETAFYFGLLIVLAAAGLAAGLVWFLRRVVRAASGERETAAGFVLARLVLPVALLAVTFLLRLEAVRNVLPLRPRDFDVVNAAFIFFVIFFVIRFFDALFRARYIRRGRQFPMPRVLHGFILAVIYLVGLFFILQRNLGVNIGPVLTTSAILTAVLGLALQGILGNILAGLSLNSTRAFSRGNWVKVGDVEGVVVETNWRETRLLDRASNIVIIPNSAVAGAYITNFALPDARAAITIPVKASFQAPPPRVLEILKEAARETSDVAPDPPPTAYLLSYDEYGVSYLAKFWITDYKRKFAIATDVGRLAWAKLRREGIEIAVPVADTVGRAIAAVRPEMEQAAEAKAVERNFRDLAGSAFLRIRKGEGAGEPALKEAELRALAGRVARLRFARDEVVFRQGEKGASCYVVAAGKVKGRIAYEEKGRPYASEFEIGAGGIVGEMSLFTGLPRTATAVAAEESELLEIRVEAFGELLAKNVRLAETLADIVTERNRENLETLGKIKEIAAHDLESVTNKKSVLEYLKRLARAFKT